MQAAGVLRALARRLAGEVPRPSASTTPIRRMGTELRTREKKVCSDFIARFV
jgi:hypothetical protein